MPEEPSFEELIKRVRELEQSEAELQHTNFQLGERVKEFNCVHEFALLVEKPGITRDELLLGLVNLIPPAWQFPEKTSARLTLNDKVFQTDNFRETDYEQNAAIYVNSKNEGQIQVFIDDKDHSDEQPFLPEEQTLLDILAKRLRHVIERINAYEDTLQKSEEKYKAMFDQSIEGNYLHDLDGRIVDVNQTACQQMGYTKNELLQLTVFDLLPEESRINMPREEILQVWKNIKPGQRIYLEGEHQRKDGSIVPVQISTGLIRHREEDMMLAIVQDITERKKLENELRKNEAQFRELTELLPEAVFETDRNITLTYVNRMALKMFGYSKKDVEKGLNGFNMLVPEDRDRAKKNLEVRMISSKEEQPKLYNYIGLRKDGTTFPIIFNASSIIIDGKFCGLRGIIVDITEQKTMEDALTLANARLKGLWGIASLSDADLHTISDYALRAIVDMTDSPYGFLGFLNDDESVMTIHRWSGDAMKDCEMTQKPTDFTITECGVWAEAVRRRKPLLLNDYQIPHDAKKGLPNGHVELSRLLVVPIFTDDKIVSVAAVANCKWEYSDADINQITAFMNSVNSVIKRKQAEQARHDSEELFRSLVEQAADGFELLDVDGYYLDANTMTCEMLGYTYKELIGKHISEIDPHIDKLKFQSVVEKMKIDGTITLDTTHKRKDQSLIPVEVAAKKITIKGIPIILSMVRDVSERKQAEMEREKLEAQLNQAQKMEAVGRLAGGVAHDFNNMLNVILGNTELLMHEVDPENPLFEDLQEIHNATERSANLTRQLLAFARKQTITPQVLNLNKTISGMLKMLQRLIGEDIKLVWTPGEELWTVIMDPGQIDQTLANLCVNSRDAIPDVGLITIVTENTQCDQSFCDQNPGAAPGDYVKITVTDTGTGMDEETLANAFEPFYTTKEINEGTGLGLATVYGIIKQNNGFITISSELDHGTTVELFIPRHIGKAEQLSELPNTQTDATGHETILLVEDEKSLLRLGKRTLTQLGYEVLAAASPVEAINIASEYSGHIHILITDVIMPEMNGRDLAKRIISLYPDIKCLFMSGYTADVIAHRGVLDKDVHFIQKPYTKNGLAAKIREIHKSDN